MVKTGRKWRAQEGLERKESPLSHRVLVGTVARGWAELEAITQLDRCRGGTDLQRKCLEKMGGNIVVEDLMFWYLAGRTTVNQVYRPGCVQCPNLHIWGKNNSPACLLCCRRGSLKHILSSCPVVLGEGCYSESTWGGSSSSQIAPQQLSWSQTWYCNHLSPCRCSWLNKQFLGRMKWKRPMRKWGPNIRSWWSSVSGETGRQVASTLKLGA